MHIQPLPCTPIRVHKTCLVPSALLICEQAKLGTYPYFGGYFFFGMVSLWTNKLLPACVHVSNELNVLELISAPVVQSFDPHPC